MVHAGRELDLERHQDALESAEKYNRSKIDLETFMQCLITLAGRDAVVRCCDLSPAQQVPFFPFHAFSDRPDCLHSLSWPKPSQLCMSFSMSLFKTLQAMQMPAKCLNK